ncbi:toxin-antitoxin system HicB family antitoxin [Clostridium botulinum]|nr:toxin-antitoxin system HicB family antitoxin [Clostridium botulinum]
MLNLLELEKINTLFILQDIKQIKKTYKEDFDKIMNLCDITCTKGPENYSGDLRVRFPKSLHKDLKEAADKEGVSLNQYIIYLLTKNQESFKREKKFEKFLSINKLFNKDKLLIDEKDEDERKFMDRRSILEKIKNASEWGIADNTENYETINKNLNFLNETLDLGSVIDELMYLEYGKLDKKTYRYLTSRQMTCMQLINKEVLQKNVQGAYHELYDFIEAYRKLNDEPISMIERIIIKNSIIQIKSILNIIQY